MHDAGSVYAGIEYLRFIDGEKRLIFVTEEGFFGHMWRISTVRMLAQHSGGSNFSSMRPEAAFARIDHTTRSQYLLGYYPTDPARDGRFRRIEVTVSRPGVTVLARRGYSASAMPPVFDRARLMTDVRVAAAAASPQNIRNVRLTVQVAPSRAPDGGRLITASGTIDATRLGWMKSDDGRRRITLELAVFCIQRDGLLVGEHRQPLILTMSQEAYEKALKSGLNYSVPIPVTAAPRQVKVIVYDQAMDLVGSQATPER